LPRKFRSQRVPTLIRFVIVVGVLAALVYGGLFYMATMVKITPHEISETIELPKAPK
jgi:putative flippase GtrA